MRNFLILLVFFSLTSSLAKAQSSDLGNWLIYFGNKKIDTRWDWHHEVQYRNYNALGDTEQLLLRTGLGYTLADGSTNLLMGYGFIHSQNYLPALGSEDKTEINEHRIFQQLISRQKISRVYVLHRYRVEERFIEEEFKMRFRYFLSLNLPLNRPQMEDNTWYLSTYNELFINGSGQYFDRNRVYAGLGFKPNGRLRLELGYMNQRLQATQRDQINIIAFVQL